MPYLRTLYTRISTSVKREQVHVFRRDDTAKDERREKATATLNRLAIMHTISFGNTGAYGTSLEIGIIDWSSGGFGGKWGGMRRHAPRD